ncbi:hypothetical protein P43SY_007761 [Pythium insidiosum]|uniref:Transposase n=1 Tax=Pythium insidiosum TaxID=114742 RepID=A0AAD5LAC8_PYTIN|nr:hypothetical protein P43SY_007761 [Pythium insidiosum]
MQKWHKKLALGVIDIARVNAYVTKCMVDGSDKSLRNQHRQFMIDLASELISVDYQLTQGSVAIRRAVRLHLVEGLVSKRHPRQTWTPKRMMRRHWQRREPQHNANPAHANVTDVPQSLQGHGGITDFELNPIEYRDI